MSISPFYRGFTRLVIVLTTCLAATFARQSNATVTQGHTDKGTSQHESCITALGSYKLNPPIYLPRGFVVRGLEVTPPESGFSRTVIVTYMITAPEPYNSVYSFYESVFKGCRARWKGYSPAGNGSAANYHFAVYPAQSTSNRYGVTYVIYKNALGPQDRSTAPLHLTHEERKQTIIYVLANVPQKFSEPTRDLYIPVPHSRTH